MIPKGKKLTSQAREVSCATAIPGTVLATQAVNRWSITFSIHRTDGILLSPGGPSANGNGLVLRTDGTNMFTFTYYEHGDLVNQQWFGRMITAVATVVVVETFLVDE